MDIKQLTATSREKAREYLSKSAERQILVQSTGLAAVVMLVSYLYGRANYTAPKVDCGFVSEYVPLDPSTCLEGPAGVAYPEPWLMMLVAGVVGTIVLGAVAATLDRSIFARYLLAGWLTFCAIIAVLDYSNYSSVGQFPGAYFVAYPATTVVSFGVAAACVASVANIFLRMREAHR